MTRVFFRLWVVASAMWIALLAWAYDGHPPSDALLTPPILLYLIGAGLAWAASGFRY